MVMENGGDHVSGKMYYISMVRSLLEVNVEIWNGRLTAKNVLDLEKIQIRCFKLILKNKYQTYIKKLLPHSNPRQQLLYQATDQKEILQAMKLVLRILKTGIPTIL